MCMAQTLDMHVIFVLPVNSQGLNFIYVAKWQVETFLFVIVKYTKE